MDNRTWIAEGKHDQDIRPLSSACMTWAVESDLRLPKIAQIGNYSKRVNLFCILKYLLGGGKSTKNVLSGKYE